MSTLNENEKYHSLFEYYYFYKGIINWNTKKENSAADKIKHFAKKSIWNQTIQQTWITIASNKQDIAGIGGRYLGPGGGLSGYQVWNIGVFWCMSDARIDSILIVQYSCSFMVGIPISSTKIFAVSISQLPSSVPIKKILDRHFLDSHFFWQLRYLNCKYFCGR